MKTSVFLRHISTRLYYSGWHSWTADVQQAVDFGNPEQAIERARSEMLSQVEVVMRSGDSGAEMLQRIPNPSKWP